MLQYIEVQRRVSVKEITEYKIRGKRVIVDADLDRDNGLIRRDLIDR